MLQRPRWPPAFMKSKGLGEIQKQVLSWTERLVLALDRLHLLFVFFVWEGRVLLIIEAG